MSGISVYQENAVTTQSRGHLVVMLYDGAIKFLRRAAIAMDAGNHEEKANCLNRATAIIDELNITLDLEHGGEIAMNLRKLYGFMIRHLNQGLIQNDSRRLREVAKLLEELNAGWKGVSG